MEATLVQSPVVANVSGNDNVAAQQNVMPLISAQQANLMRERIAQLSIEVSAWESGAYASSNAILYGLLQKAYGLYLDLTNSTDPNLKYKKQGLADYLALNALAGYEDKPLPQRIIACVFGKRDRRRMSTYHVVLRYIIAQKWDIAEVPVKISEAGGVQEISLGRPSGSMTAKQKAEVAANQVNQTVLAHVQSTELSKHFNPENTGDQFAAVLTQEADGSFTVNCLVKSTTAVNAALAAYFTANKDALKQSVSEHEASVAQSNTADLKAAAINHPLAA